MHDELELLVGSGTAPMQAIVAATSRAAELLGLADQIGVVKPGYLADLLVVRGDPASSITATRSVAGHQIRPDRLHGKTLPASARFLSAIGAARTASRTARPGSRLGPAIDVGRGGLVPLRFDSGQPGAQGVMDKTVCVRTE